MKMLSRLEPEEWDYLTKNFGIAACPTPNRTGFVPSKDLLDEDKCTAYLDRLTEILRSPSRMTTASLFAKRYAYLTVTPSLYAMTVYNKGLDVSSEHVFLEAPEDHSRPWTDMYLHHIEVTEPVGGKRDEWREAIVRSLFAENITRLWHTISKVAGVPMPILWENTAVRVFSLYEKRMEAGAGREERLRTEDDFAYLVQKAPGALFGEMQNPFAAFYNDAPAVSSTTPSVRMRKTCCFYYQISTNGEHCAVCPKAK